MATFTLKDFNGFKMPPEFNEYIERIENLEVRNDDVWVTSFPKCGTTWTQEMVWLIGNDLNYEGAKTELDFRFPFLECNSFYEEWNNFRNKFNINFKEAEDEVDFFEMVEKNENVRYIKSHVPWDFLPKQIKDGTKNPKIIHVMRDPKQVATSYYHHCSNIFPVYKGDLNTFIDLYIQGKVLIGDYFNVVLSYWKRRNLPNILFLTYEEMYSDLKGVVNKVSNFLGKSYSENEIDELVQHLSFDQMKINKAVNKESVVQTEDARFMRIGKTDSYKTELNEEMIDKLNKWVLENVKGTNLPYETS
ncbi:luciferin sulfotransferase-like isoform X2 [Onthophagus taurus]|uniref:luciferin sulfotransferase-like isoform X2 n=1 Tax=Onthophagus taurus TaxID=166361 RepID=UPI0039BE6D66